MPSPFSSLLLATSLVALPGSAATASTTASSFTQAPVPAGGNAPKGATAAPSKTRPTTPTSRGKRTTRATPAARNATGKAPATIKDARKADCDTPEAKVAAVKPPPVPADPFAPVVAPCAEPKP